VLAAIVRTSLANPRIVTALSVLIGVLGVAALFNARFDVFPDFAPPHVLVQTEAPGLDATQVEALVTRPLEGLLAGSENVTSVRSTSSQGLSAIQVVFDRTGDPYRQRQVVTERLADAAGLLPAGVGPPLLSPLSSSMEYLVHFGFTSAKLSPIELRDLVQWVIKPQILAVPGVAQAQIFGGEARERQVMVDPVKLAAAYGVPAIDINSQKDLSSLAAFLAAPGPGLCQVHLDPAQEYEPRLKSRQLPDGTMVSPNLEDMYPFLDRAEVEANLLALQEASISV